MKGSREQIVRGMQVLVNLLLKYFYKIILVEFHQGENDSINFC